MLHFFMFFIIPVAAAWFVGAKRVSIFLLFVVVALVILFVGSVAGFFFELMFYPDNVSGYAGPGFYTNSYAEGMTTIGQGFALPYIFVFDVFNQIVHYTFTRATWVMWIFQVYAIYIIFDFLRRL